MSMNKWATSQSTNLSTKVWVKLLLLLENALKTQFLRPSSWEFEPSPRPHQHFDLNINTHTTQVKNYIYGFIVAYIGVMLQA